jgi:hypothetical protein
MSEEIYSKNPNPNYNLITSTSSFVFPIIYSCKKNNMVLFAVSTAALLGSINFWRRPAMGYMRNVDLLTSNFSGIIYIYYGFYIDPVFPKLFGLINIYFIWFLYNKSCKYYHLQDDIWINYHMLFHLYVTFSKMYVIYWV